MRKRVWMGVDDIVLVNIREFQTDRCDICYKYNEDEVKNLLAYGEIPSLQNNYKEKNDVDIDSDSDNDNDNDNDNGINNYSDNEDNIIFE